VLRSDGDETNFYLQQFIKQTAPEIWQHAKDANPLITFEPITERNAVHPYASRDGASQQAAELASHFGGDPLTGETNGGTSAVIAPVPASAKSSVLSAYPKATVYPVEIKNANDDWVAPTPESINKAVDAGGETPLYAMTNKVPGAYPLVWVNRLYAPARGLSAEKTEAIATVIRYIATVGQAAAAPVGEGRLPDSLVHQALSAADQLVQSNCTGSGMKLESSSDAGPMAPAAMDDANIGPMLHCVATRPATSTTVPTTVTTAPSSFDAAGNAGSDGFTDGSGTTSGGASALAAGSSEGSETAAGATGGVEGAASGSAATADALLTASHLPMPAPGSVPLPDRAATFLLGVGLFLLLRKPVMRFTQRALG
jgi:hypothetical protein